MRVYQLLIVFLIVTVSHAGCNGKRMSPAFQYLISLQLPPKRAIETGDVEKLSALLDQIAEKYNMERIDGAPTNVIRIYYPSSELQIHLSSAITTNGMDVSFGPMDPGLMLTHKRAMFVQDIVIALQAEFGGRVQQIKP